MYKVQGIPRQTEDIVIKQCILLRIIHFIEVLKKKSYLRRTETLMSKIFAFCSRKLSWWLKFELFLMVPSCHLVAILSN